LSFTFFSWRLDKSMCFFLSIMQQIEAKYEATVKSCNEEIEYERSTGTEILDIILSTKERTQATLKRVEDVAAQSIEVFRDLVSSS
jgi:hypothetical protein